MTNTKRHFTNPLIKNDNLRIPSRDEFHRYTSNKLANGDFCTDYSSGYQISRIVQALDWTRKKCINKKGRINN